MATINDGGPAFPNQAKFTEGMSLRDWFAGQALMGYLAMNSHPSSCRSLAWDLIAKDAYSYADAMLIQRAKKS